MQGHRGRWLGIALLLAAPSLWAEAASSAWPGWDGQVKLGRTSELTVQLNLQAGTIARVEVSTASHRFSQLITATSKHPQILRLPFVADSSGAVQLSVNAESVVLTQRVPVTVLAESAPLLVSALAAPAADYLAAAPPHVLQLAAQALPWQALAYDSVDAVLVDSAALNQLQAQQRDALRAFVARCGSVYLVATTPAQTAELRGYAGCAGHSLHIFENWAQVSTNSVAQDRWDQASLQALARASVTASSRSWLSPALLLVTFLLGLLLIIVTGLRERWLLGWAAVTTVLTLVSFWQRPPQLQTHSWSEMTAPAQIAQTQQLVAISGAGRWQGPIMIEALAGAPHQLNEARATEWLISNNTMALLHSSGLGTRQLIAARRSEALQPGITIRLTGAAPSVTNSGTKPSAAGYFWWQDSFYRLPALNPDTVWSADNDAIISGATPLLQLMHRRLDGAPAAVLLQLSDTTAHRQWLLLRQRSGESLR